MAALSLELYPLTSNENNTEMDRDQLITLKWKKIDQHWLSFQSSEWNTIIILLK